MWRHFTVPLQHALTSWIDECAECQTSCFELSMQILILCFIIFTLLQPPCDVPLCIQSRKNCTCVPPISNSVAAAPLMESCGQLTVTAKKNQNIYYAYYWLYFTHLFKDCRLVYIIASQYCTFKALKEDLSFWRKKYTETSRKSRAATL